MLLRHALLFLPVITACVDFSSFQPGDILTDLGKGVRVEGFVMNKESKPKVKPGECVIFNSTKPLGNILTLSEDVMSHPGVKKNGGRFDFYFDPPRHVDTIGLLGIESEVTIQVNTTDGMTELRISRRGDNSFERVFIGIPNVHKITVSVLDSAAITDIGCPAIPDCPPDIDVDFETFQTGAMVTDLGYGIAITANRYDKKGVMQLADAMIFDSSSPSGDDFDLGTPHISVGGPGIESGGRKGRPFENVEARGKILIISEDGDRSDPDDAAYGGVMDFTFALPLYISDIGLLDNEEGARIVAVLEDGETTEIDVPGRSNNSFETVQIQLPAVIALSLDFSGSVGLTHIKASRCDDEPMPPSMAPLATPRVKPTAAPIAKRSAAPSNEPSVAASDESISLATRKPVVAPKPYSAPTKAPVDYQSLTKKPTKKPVAAPTKKPTAPSAAPSNEPSAAARDESVSLATKKPVVAPTKKPYSAPTTAPVDFRSLTKTPTKKPVAAPTKKPIAPSAAPSNEPSAADSDESVTLATNNPAAVPTKKPVVAPTKKPTMQPVTARTKKPVPALTKRPTKAPIDDRIITKKPTKKPAAAPTMKPVTAPTKKPVPAPTKKPAVPPTKSPVDYRSLTKKPTKMPTRAPTKKPVTAPTKKPASAPTKKPVPASAKTPTKTPVDDRSITKKPTKKPAPAPTMEPVTAPTKKSVPAPTKKPAVVPTKSPIDDRSLTKKPTMKPVTASSKKPAPPPANAPVSAPTFAPVISLTTMKPVPAPTKKPVTAPTKKPIVAPSMAPSLECPPDIDVDFESFQTGDTVSDLGNGITVAAFRHGRGDELKLAEAMIFDSSKPTGDDADLGRPHKSVLRGPGRGAAGRTGRPFQNVKSLGKILIISEDGDSSDPDDAAHGGLLDFAFARPLDIRDIGVLDNEEGVRILAVTVDGKSKAIDVPGRGNNSFETVEIQLSQVVVLSIEFVGSGALTHFKASICEENAKSVFPEY